MASERDAAVETTETSLAIVDFVKERDGARVSEIADAFDRSRSTIHSHVTTLSANGYLRKEGDTYILGMELYHLGSRAKRGKRAHVLAGKTVDELAERSGEEADFCVVSNGRLISLYDSIAYSEEGSYNVGEYFYMHNTAIGKAILAEMADDRVEEIVDEWGLPAVTDDAITDRAELFDCLDAVRERGYAINDEEIANGLRAVGTAVTMPDGSVFGGFSIGGPKYRMGLDDVHGRYSSLLLDTVAAFEETIAESPSEHEFESRRKPDDLSG